MMPRYVLDEHLRGPLWRTVQWHNNRRIFPIDVVRVGDPVDLPLGTTDPELLLWAEREGRIMVSDDRDTLPAHLADHLHSGRSSPGVFFIRRQVTLVQIVSFLVDAAYASDASEWGNLITYIP